MIICPAISPRYIFLFCGFAFVCGLSVSVAQDNPGTKLGFPSANDNRFSLQTDAEADEQLFLVRVFESYFNSWPADFSNRKAASARVAQLQYELSKLHTYAASQKMDDLVVRMFQDASQHASEYGKMLVDLKIIDSVSAGRKSEGIRNGLFATARDTATGAVTGWTRGGPLGAVVYGGGALLYRGFSEYINVAGIDGENKIEIERHINEFMLRRQRLLGKIEVSVRVLAKKNSWDQEEVGFKELDRRNNDGDASTDELLIKTRGLARVRPRDPFVAAMLGGLLAPDEDFVGSPDARIKLFEKAAEKFIRAAELVPQNRIHDKYRAEFLADAVRCKLRAAELNAKPTNDPLATINRALSFDREDASGELRRLRALALVRSGKASTAVQVMTAIGPLFKNDPQFLFDAACCANAMLKTDVALKYLDEAIENGYEDILAVRTHPDFSRILKDQSKKYSQLITPTWTQKLDFQSRFLPGGYNKYTMTNTSAFVISNVGVVVKWTRNDDEVFYQPLFVKRIEPGSDYTWYYVLPDAYKHLNKELKGRSNCDQLRPIARRSLESLAGTYQGVLARTNDTPNVKNNSDVTVEIKLSKDGSKASVTFKGDKSETPPKFTLSGQSDDRGFHAEDADDVTLWIRVAFDDQLFIVAPSPVSENELAVIWAQKQAKK